MINARSAFAGILAGFVTLFAFTGSADAAPANRGSAARSVCETGYRGMPQYNSTCLTVGTFRDGVMLWLDTDRRDRRDICTASRPGGIRAAVREAFHDVAYDSYRNYGTVLTYASLAAYADCLRMYRVK